MERIEKGRVAYAMTTAATAAAPARIKEAALMLAAPVYFAMAPVPVAELSNC